MTHDLFTDGLEAMQEALSVGDVMKLIEKTARWVSPETYGLLPLWYPEYSRRTYFYKSNWSEPQLNTNRKTSIRVHKQEGNTHANEALAHALGLRKKERPNWSCCHIWGTDDNAYQSSSDVVQDPRYFSCVANMVLLPSPLKAFTDVMPEVKRMLRFCAFRIYNWKCPHESVAASAKTLEKFEDWKNYPKSWPKHKDDAMPAGVVDTNQRIRDSIRRRKSRISKDLRSAGPYYPKDQVREVLKYWNISLGGE